MADTKFTATKLSHELSAGYGPASISCKGDTAILAYPSLHSVIELRDNEYTFKRTSETDTKSQYTEYTDLLRAASSFLSHPRRNVSRLDGISQVPPMSPALVARFNFLQSKCPDSEVLFKTGRCLVSLLHKKHADPEVGIQSANDNDYLELHYPGAKIYIDLYISPDEYTVTHITGKKVNGTFDRLDIGKMAKDISAFIELSNK